MKPRGAWAGAALALVAATPQAVRGAFDRAPLTPWAASLGGPAALALDPGLGNPAPPFLDDLPLWQVSTSVCHPFGVAALREETFAVCGSSLPVAVGAHRFGGPDYAERTVRLSYGRAPSPSLRWGWALNGREVAGAGFSPRRAPAVDFGFRVRPDVATEIGVFAETVFGEIPADPQGRRRRTALGLARRHGPVRLLIELQRREDRLLSANAGLSWQPRHSLAVACGVTEDPHTLSAGLSIELAPLSIEASVTNHAPLGRTLRIGVRLRSANSAS